MGFPEQMGGILGAVAREFDLMNAILNTWRKKEHKSDGSHAALTSDTFVNAGKTDFGGPWMVPQTAVVAASITADQDDFRPLEIDDAWVMRISTDASRTITGIYNFDLDHHRIMLVINVGNFDLVLSHSDGASSARYRISCPGAVDLTLTSGEAAILFYDHSSGPWRVIGY